MNSRKLLVALCVVCFAFVFGAFGSRAQDQPSQQPPDNTQQPLPDNTQPPDNSNEPFPGGPPKPAGASFPGLIGTEGELQPDFSPLTGFQNSTLGMPQIRHSYWVPGVQYSSTVESAPVGGGGGSGWYANNYFVGNLSVVQAWDRDMFAVNYSGGGVVSTDSAYGNGSYQRLGLANTYRSERWLFQIVDFFSQSPQSEFGYGGGTGLGIPGIGGSLGTTIPGLGGNYAPNQSIYGVGPFISNTGAIQANYALSRRASVTVSGSYGILHFTKSGNIDTNSWIASVGYNYAISRADTIGVVYRFGSYQYPGDPQAYTDQVASFAYGRKITGRLAARVIVGPEFLHYRIAIGGDSRSTGFSASAHLTYGFERGSATINYLHGLYGGSGVLIGSITDDVSAGYSRPLSRLWVGNLGFGYAHNRPVGGTNVTGYPAYSDWFMTAGLGRPLGRYVHMNFAYTATIGNYGGYGCGGTACNIPNETYHTVTVNLSWHPRPFVLR